MSSVASLYRLVDLIPPPDSPVRNDGDWKRFASSNGFWPPEDYRMLIREYGTGTFANWLTLIEPFNHNWSFLQYVDKECRSLRGRGPIWPEEGGFLPWATTSSGDHVGWRTLGGREAWTTLFWGKGGDVHDFQVSAVGFLIGLVERNLGDPAFDRDNPFAINGGPTFEPVER